MKKIIKTNSQMQSLLLNKDSFTFCIAKKKKIRTEILNFLDNMQIIKIGTNKIFVSKEFLLTENIFQDFSCLTDIEWDNNEIFLCGAIIGKQFRKSINIALEVIESFLIEKFPQNSFYIDLSVQYGALRNIVIRIYLNRGSSYLTSNLEEYSEPILEEIFTI